MILEITGMKKNFGGLAAINNVNLSVQAGTIHALIGPNGAGKTTLFNCITGVKPCDSGKILWQDESIEDLKTHEIARKGIGRTFQNIRLFPYMTVLENVLVGTHHLGKGGLAGITLRTPGARKEEKQMREFSMRLLERVGLLEKNGQYARNLPYGEQRRLEIARALAGKPKLLLLDEPAAGMNIAETSSLDNFIRSLKDDSYTILLIEHDMKLVMSIADVISVLDHGVKIAEGGAREIQENEKVVEAYLGKRRFD